MVDTFAAHASRLLKVNDLGRVPVLGFSDVEARRARAIAQLVLDAGLSALSQPPVISDTDLSKPMTAYYLEDRVRQFGFQENRAGNWDSRDLAFALADLAKAVGSARPCSGMGSRRVRRHLDQCSDGTATSRDDGWSPSRAPQSATQADCEATHEHPDAPHEHEDSSIRARSRYCPG